MVKVYLFLIFSCWLFSEPLDPSLVKTGDVIGVSSRKELTGFIVQAATRSPIDHVGIIIRENDRPFVYHLTFKGVHKEDFQEFLDHYKSTNGEVYGMVARPTALGGSQVESLKSFLNHPPAESLKNPSCSFFVHKAYSSVGVKLGLIESVDYFDSKVFGGAVEDHIKKFFHGQGKVVPSISLFQKGASIVAQNVSEHWDIPEMIKAWRETADVSRLARTYFGINSAAADQNISNKFLDEIEQAYQHDICLEVFMGVTSRSGFNRLNPLRLAPRFRNLSNSF